MEQQRGSGSSSRMAQKFDPCKKKARTPGERPGGESRGIFHFKQGGRAGSLCFFLSMYSPRAHPGPPSPMDSEILTKPLSLWPEYSTGGQLDSVKKWGIGCTHLCTPKLRFKGYAPRMHPNYSCFSWPCFVRLCYMKKPRNRCGSGVLQEYNAWRTEARGGRL